MKKSKVLDYESQYQLADSFIVHNTNEQTVPINYKMTSQTWAELISKWSGVEVSPDVVIEVCKQYSIESKEICRGVFVFAMKVIK